MKTDNTGRLLSNQIHDRWEKTQREYRAEVMAALPEILDALVHLGRIEMQASHWHRVGISRAWAHLHEVREILLRKVEETKHWESK